MSEDTVLKFPANEEVDVRLKSTKPFWQGVDSYQKERFGYELHGDINGKEKFYCSLTCHELIQASGVKELDLFRLMLKNENNKSIWLLSKDGKEWKNKYQFGNENIENNIRSNDNGNVNINDAQPSGINLADEVQKIKVRLDALEKQVQSLDSKSLKESEIPF